MVSKHADYSDEAWENLDRALVLKMKSGKMKIAFEGAWLEETSHNDLHPLLGYLGEFFHLGRISEDSDSCKFRFLG
jgi:hypothetical protein